MAGPLISRAVEGVFSMLETSRKVFWRDHKAMGPVTEPNGIGTALMLPKGSEFVGARVVDPKDWTVTEVWVDFRVPEPAPDEQVEFRFCLVTDGLDPRYAKSRHLCSFPHSPDGGQCHVHLDLDPRSFVEQMQAERGPRWGTAAWVAEFLVAQGDWEAGRTPNIVEPSAL